MTGLRTMLDDCFCLRFSYCSLLRALCVFIASHLLLFNASAQMGAPKANSPLYNSRPYSPSAPTGLPKALDDVGIDQRLNQQLPLDVELRDEAGRLVKLRDYFGKKPVILSLVFYECRMLCNQVLNGMVSAFRVMSFRPGEEFEVVTVSFDSRETAALAYAKKQTYIDYLPEANRVSAITGWHFLTGDDISIQKLTDAIGFRYRFDAATNQFAHASAIYIATSEGKLARYFYGIEYAPRDLRLGLIEASENRIGSAVDQLLLYCYHYDPSTGKYGAVVMNMIRAGGVATLFAMLALLLILRRQRSVRRMHVGQNI